MGFFDFISNLFAEDKVMLTMVNANGTEKEIEIIDAEQALQIVDCYVERTEKFELHFIDSQKNGLTVMYDPEEHDDFLVMLVQGGDYDNSRCVFSDHDNPAIVTLAVTAFMEGDIDMDFIIWEKD